VSVYVFFAALVLVRLVGSRPAVLSNSLSKPRSSLDRSVKSLSPPQLYIRGATPEEAVEQVTRARSSACGRESAVENKAGD
jgi:hypothetical protein